MKKFVIFLTILFPLYLFSQTDVLIVNKTTGPYYTITNALKAAQPGDIVEIRDNSIYNEKIVITKNYITLKAAENVNPILTYDVSFDDVIAIETNNVKIENLRIEIPSSATSMKGIAVYNYGANVLIQNCTIVNYADPLSSDSTGIYFGNSDWISNNIVRNCSISNFKYAITMDNSSKSMEIYNNTIYNSVSGIWVDESDNNRIYRNTIQNCGYGITITSSISGGANFNAIFYNVVFNCTNNGISLGSLDSVYVEIYNNTIVKNKNGLYVGSPNNNYTIYLINNILYYNQDYDLYFNTGAMSVDVYLYNNCYSTLTNGLIDITNSGNINTEPAFVGLDNNDFHLSASSPCIDAGMDIEYYALFGVDIPIYNRRDIGAYEYTPPEEIALPPAREKSEYIRLSSNSFTIGEETSIFIVNLDEINKDSVYLKVEIFDLRGKLIKNLYEGTTSPDSIMQLSWDGKDSNNNYTGAGLYILKVQINNVTTTEKIFFVP